MLMTETIAVIVFSGLNEETGITIGILVNVTQPVDSQASENQEGGHYVNRMLQHIMEC